VILALLPAIAGIAVAATSATAADTATIRINEVESNGGTPGDWVELVNTGTSAVAVSAALTGIRHAGGATAEAAGLACAAVDTVVVGTTGNERLTGTAGGDLIVGLGGNDVVDGGAGLDSASAGRGNNTNAGSRCETFTA
jgi:Ca2+-binding RTX toxin-like protein